MNNVNLGRKLNYGVKKKGDQFSWVRPVGPGDFPRFHLFIDRKEDKLKFELHLDQKKACYESSNAHNGDYDGKRVEEEAERIKSIIKRL